MIIEYNPNNQGTKKFVIVQKNGPNSLAIGIPKIMTTNLRIQKGTYVLVYQVADKIIIEKAISGGEE